MKTFAALINRLDSTNKTNLKLEAVEQFLRDATDNDKLWLLALFTGKRPKRKVSTTLLKEWAIAQADIPEWLFKECYASVGDLAETISLLLTDPQRHDERSLSEWMVQIRQLDGQTELAKKAFVTYAWQNLPHQERFIFNKLLGGSFRMGLSAKGLVNALARHYRLDANTITHAIMGAWNTDEVSFSQLISGQYTNTQLSKPYPFCLAYAIDKDVESFGDTNGWQVEYKWDGIRGQFIKREGEVFIWSRGEELVTDQFPELRDALLHWDHDFVLDGELLAFKNGRILNFSELQKRLNRKKISKKITEEVPVAVYAYDLLELERKDLREEPLTVRRDMLEKLFADNRAASLQLSPIIAAPDWDSMKATRANARDVNSEGLMLKRKTSIYHTGRKKGDWWKWKIDPFTIDAVLIYAQKGSGRRSGYYTDYTFAVRQDDQLVTIAKAYSGLTDKEIQEVSRFVNKNALEKFGPVRTVKPELVFEIAFEGIGFSNRHKSGVALRFPRIVRWRRDKNVAEIDDIETIKKLIT